MITVIEETKRPTFTYLLENVKFTSEQALRPQHLSGPQTRLSRLYCMPQDLIWGSLLGDGYLNPRGCCTFAHSVAQSPYLFWKWETLRSAGYTRAGSCPKFEYIWDPRTNKWTYLVRFYSRTLFQQEFSRCPSGEKTERIFL